MISLRCVAFALVAAAAARAAAPAPLSPITDEALASLGVRDVRHAALSDTPAEHWQTALMSGNGETGLLAMGRPERETLILTRAGVFLPQTPPHDPPAQGDHLAEIRAMLAKGAYQPAAEFVYDLGQKEGFHGLHWTDPFDPLCSLQIANPAEAGAVHGYLRSVDYPTGVVAQRWSDDRGTVNERAFVSRADDVVVLRLSSADRPRDWDLRFVLHDASVAPSDDRPPADAFRDVVCSASGTTLGFSSNFAKAWPGSVTGARASARVFAPEATIAAKGDTLQVRGARDVLVLIKLDSVPSGIRRDRPSPPNEPREPALAESLARLPESYDALLARHMALHGAIFNRAHFDLGGAAADHRLPSRQLFQKSTLEHPLPALLEKQFDASRYLILSASGDHFPPTLQGIWGGTWKPGWSGDYTNDGNLPVAIIGDLPGNMPELLRGFFAYQESLLPDYRRNAQQLFHARGIVVPPRSSSHGLTNHFHPRWCLTFWTAGGAWMAHTFYDYYLYTGDRAFLREHAIPFMKEVALFYEDFLAGTEDAQGHVLFSPSYSPENNPANSDSQACVDATMDVAACHELLQNLIAACEQEKIDADGVARWKTLLHKLPPYRINEDGALAEWAVPYLKDNYAHRHVSHLYALFDGRPAELDAEPALARAFEVAVEKRTAWRRQIGGGEMAFGQAQMGSVAASLRRADIAFENLGMLSNWFWFTDSMMTSHNPHSLFNTDIAGGIPQLITHLLLDSQPGWIELLPAVPSDWPTGRLVGARVRGQIEVRELAWSPQKIHLSLLSPIDQTVELRTHGGQQKNRVDLHAGRAQEIDLAR